MSDYAVCALIGCGMLVEKRPDSELLFCSEMHLALFLIMDLQLQVAELTRNRPVSTYLNLSDVSVPIPIRRCGTLK